MEILKQYGFSLNGHCRDSAVEYRLVCLIGGGQSVAVAIEGLLADGQSAAVAIEGLHADGKFVAFDREGLCADG